MEHLGGLLYFALLLGGLVLSICLLVAPLYIWHFTKRTARATERLHDLFCEIHPEADRALEEKATEKDE